MTFSKKNKGGYSIIEILIAVVFFTTSISMTIILLSSSQDITVNRENDIIAKNLSREGLSGASVIIKNNWYGIADGEYGLLWENNNWSFSGTQDTENIFKRKISVNTVENGERVVKSTVTWQETPLRPEDKVEISTIFTNWFSLITTGGDEGGGNPIGDWTNPQSLGSADVGAGNSATDVDVINNIVYVSSESSNKSKPDVHVFDASNPSSPFKLDEVDLESYSASSIDYSGNYVYSAATGVIPDLKIVDAADPNTISLASEFNVITFVNALSTFKTISNVFLGVQKTSFNGEFFSINVSDPLNPAQSDVFEINGDVSKIYIKNDLAYLATSRDDRELFILDVSDPANIQQSGYLNMSGTTNGTSVFVKSPNQVFLGVGNVLNIIDATNPANPIIKGSLDVGGTINDIYAVDNLVFLATSNSNKEFQVVNIVDLSHPIAHSSLNFPQIATGVDYENNLVYVSVRSNDGLRIITSAQ